MEVFIDSQATPSMIRKPLLGINKQGYVGLKLFGGLDRTALFANIEITPDNNMDSLQWQQFQNGILPSIAYAGANDGRYVLAAMDMMATSVNRNNHRWHGVRDDNNSPFDPLRSPLAGYLDEGKVKKCPEKVNFVKNNPTSWDFEDGCGGYGYNMTYVGSRIWEQYNDKNCRRSAIRR